MVRYLLQPTRPFLAKVTPAQASLTLFAAMFGAMFFIRTVIERRFYFTKFKSFLIGDSIGFPLFGFFAALQLRGYSAENRWFDRRLTQLLLLIFFTLTGEWNYRQGQKNGTMEDWRLHAPSERYHTRAFGPVGATITHAGLSILLGTKAKKRTKAITLSPLLLWIGGVIWDIIRLPK